MSKTRRRDHDGIYSRPDSPNYWASYIDASGKRARRSTGTSNKGEATATLAKWRVEAREQKHWGAKAPRGFEEMMLAYLKYASDKRSARNDRGRTGKLLDYFAGRDVYSLSSADRREYVALRASTGVSNSTINRELSLLSTAIKYVNRELDWDVPNICTGGRLREQPDRTRWLTEDEVEALLVAAESEPRATHLADFIRLAIHTGMRHHEILFDVVEGIDVGLTWDRVDLKQSLIYFSYRHQKNGRHGSVPLNRVARDALLSRARFRAEHCPDAEYVFVSEDGKPFRSVRRSFRTALRRAAIEPCRIHDLRHTCASWLVQRGVPLVKVCELMRHSDIRTTMRYAHLAPSDSREAVAALESDESRLRHVAKNALVKPVRGG